MIGHARLDINRLDTDADTWNNWTDKMWSGYFYHHQSDIPIHAGNGKRILDPFGSDSDMLKLKHTVSYLNSIDQSLELFYADETAAVIGYNNLRFVLPVQIVQCIYPKDYSDISSQNIAALMNSADPSLIYPALKDAGTKNEMIARQDDMQQRLDGLHEEKQKIEAGEAEELADLKAQLDEIKAQMEEKKQSLLAVLAEKQAEMEAKMNQYKRELFMLETEIYGMRCYLGEVVSFYTVRNGRPAPGYEPIIVYQKIRFLDEELGRYLSLYAYGDYDDDKETFLSVLKHRDDMAEFFAPGSKSISVVRISRTGHVKGMSDKVANMLVDYEMFHENQLAVIIRNGEQIHMTWLDADKINVSDDNAFFRPGVTTETVSDPGKTDHFSETKRKQEEERNRNEILSRWFFFNVLQGVLDNTDLINIPEKANLIKNNSRYVVFSLAEGWLEESRYGTFADMTDRSKDIPLMKGDHVLTGMHITRDDAYRDRDRRWSNDRGIGDKNRTSDVSLPGKKIMKVNKVIPGLRVLVEWDRCKASIKMDPEGDAYYWHEDTDGHRYMTNYPQKGDTFAEYRATYKQVFDDDVVESCSKTCVISGDDWYGYRGITSYLNLSESDLKRLSNMYENSLFYMEASPFSDTPIEHSVYDLKDAYEHDLEVFYRKITGVRILEETDHQYYISVKKTSWTGADSWVNFRFYPDEVIPLPFLCSTWIRSVIRTGHIGDYKMGNASMSFADMLPYLQQILQYLEERESQEKALLVECGGQDIAEKEEWDAELCAWKIEHEIHYMTPARTKRFIKDMRR